MSRWACLIVLLTVAVSVSVIFLRYAGQLPSMVSFSNARMRGSTTLSSSFVLSVLWIMCVAIPLCIWFWLPYAVRRFWIYRAPFGPLAGMTTTAGIFAATFVVRYGADSTGRALDGLIAIGGGIAVGYIVRALGPREAPG